MDSAEIEFLAENEQVTIVPNFSKDKLFLIRGDVGPFNASMPVEVPVWLAVSLRQQQRCRIIPPAWMDVEKLTEKKEEETSTDIFTKMPSEYYMEMAQLLLNCASDDIPYSHKIRTLIKDIWDARMSKLRSSIQTFLTSEATHAKLNHLTRLEINTMRPILTGALNQTHALRNNLINAAFISSSFNDTLN